MTPKEIYDSIYKRYYDEGFKFRKRYNLDYSYSRRQQMDDALTLTYYEIRDYRYKETELVRYATKCFLERYPELVIPHSNSCNITQKGVI